MQRYMSTSLNHKIFMITIAGQFCNDTATTPISECHHLRHLALHVTRPSVGKFLISGPHTLVELLGWSAQAVLKFLQNVRICQIMITMSDVMTTSLSNGATLAKLGIASSTPMMSSTVPSTTLIPTTAPVITTLPPTTSCTPGVHSSVHSQSSKSHGMI